MNQSTNQSTSRQEPACVGGWAGNLADWLFDAFTFIHASYLNPAEGVVLCRCSLQQSVKRFVAGLSRSARWAGLSGPARCCAAEIVFISHVCVRSSLLLRVPFWQKSILGDHGSSSKDTWGSGIRFSMILGVMDPIFVFLGSQFLTFRLISGGQFSLRFCI